MVIALAAIVLVQISSLNSIAAGVALSGVILLIWCGILILLRAENVFTVTGDLLGPYGNRNGLAYALLQSVPAALAMRFANRAVNVAKWSIVTALCFGIFATGSKTSLLVLLILFAFACGYLLLRWKRVIGLAYIAGGVFLVAVAALNFETVLGVLGKTDSISGRIPMWAALVPLIAARPITGYGWSLALPVGAPPSVAIQETLFGNAVLYHAHNEVLNWLITTGIVGALLVLAIYGLVLWAGIRIVGTTELVAASWISMGGLVLLLRGTTDISETLPQGWFILMILAAASVKFMPDSTSGLRGKWLWINANRAGRVTSTSTRVRPRERGRGATQFNNPSELEVYSGSESASFKE
jgi:exopolysaccharide production protein ExoQ